MDTYIIIGRASVGKSSLVRALTGIRNADERLMASLGGTNFKLWAKDSSLQEARIDPLSFIADVTARNVDAVLLTLWPQSRTSGGVVYPDAAGYIREFVRAGWIIQPVVILNTGGPMIPVILPAGVLSTHISNVRTVPFNTFVGSVRAHWGWI